MKAFAVLVTLLSLFGLLGSPTVVAAYDLASILPNVGFESGLASWSYTGNVVNANTFLTFAEWSTQSWSGSSPFYTDGQLTGYYPGKPWGLNPDITHIQQTGGPIDPTTTITAPVGSNFVGSRQDGYSGHYLTGGVPSTPDSYYDTNFQLSNTISATYGTGDVFTLTVWANRGRLRQDWGNIGDSTLRLRLIGEAGATDYNVFYDFTNWGVDGSWASQVFTWTLDRDVSSLKLVVTGQNTNHDRYVAVDMGTPVPLPAALYLLASGLVALVGIRRFKR